MKEDEFINLIKQYGNFNVPSFKLSKKCPCKCTSHNVKFKTQNEKLTDAIKRILADFYRK